LFFHKHSKSVLIIIYKKYFIVKLSVKSGEICIRKKENLLSKISKYPIGLTGVGLGIGGLGNA